MGAGIGSGKPSSRGNTNKKTEAEKNPAVYHNNKSVVLSSFPFTGYFRHFFFFRFERGLIRFMVRIESGVAL